MNEPEKALKFSLPDLSLEDLDVFSEKGVFKCTKSFVALLPFVAGVFLNMFSVREKPAESMKVVLFLEFLVSGNGLPPLIAALLDQSLSPLIKSKMLSKSLFLLLSTDFCGDVSGDFLQLSVEPRGTERLSSTS